MKLKIYKQLICETYSPLVAYPYKQYHLECKSVTSSNNKTLNARLLAYSAETQVCHRSYIIAANE
jgi:hypothetical protein